MTPSSTTVYTLTATGPGGSNTATVRVMVASAGDSSPTDTPALSGVPVINSFTASPAAISIGGSAMLSWNVSNASSVTISPGIGNVANTGSREVSPTGTTAYLITATNGDVVKTVSVVVEVSNVTGVDILTGWVQRIVAYNFIERAPSAKWRSSTQLHV